VDLLRKRRLEELRKRFLVTEVNGTASPHAVVAETIAAFLNGKYGRPVVVPRDRKGSPS